MSTTRTARAKSNAHIAHIQQLRRALAECSLRIDKLEHEVEINIRRMAAMQAEIDHVRSMRQRS
jgi:hypothetical protein